jgi:hypothetical protein
MAASPKKRREVVSSLQRGLLKVQLQTLGYF